HMHGRQAKATREPGVRAVWEALREVVDPEIPVVSVVDLGMIHEVTIDPDQAAVRVALLPTFIGCPAISLIRQAIVDRLQRLPHVARVNVEIVYDPPWSTDRISEEGRRKLAQFGISPPRRCSAMPAMSQGATGSPGSSGPGRSMGSTGSTAPGMSRTAAAPATPAVSTGSATCPFCGSDNTRLDNRFGPTPCRSIWYCLDCRNPFEQMKSL
ncbi:MAG TPA: iron-sulfur cluster assembly protein, partial [Thermaerobacter sp.]